MRIEAAGRTAQQRMSMIQSRRCTFAGELSLLSARAENPFDSIAMDSSSDHLTDLTRSGARRAGDTGNTRMPRAQKAAFVFLYSIAICGNAPHAARRPYANT